MTSGSDENQRPIDDSVEENPIGLDMAIPVSVPNSVKRMRPAADGERFLGLEEIHDPFELVKIPALFPGAPQIPLEGRGRSEFERHALNLLAQFPERTIAPQRSGVVSLAHCRDGFLIRYRHGKRKSFVQLHLLQKQADRFGRCDANAREDSLGRLLEFWVDSSVDHLGFFAVSSQGRHSKRIVSHLRSSRLLRVPKRRLRGGTPIPS